MSRVFWLAMGVTAGAVVSRKITRTLDALSPQSVAGSLAEGLAILGDGVRDFVDDVRDGMGERERVLAAQLGLPDAEGRHLLYLAPGEARPAPGTTDARALEGPETQEH
ncbi:hypothetical protein [Vallicoccus soli]|uniref:Uncharacterized protein n=1 Tax=Vallicoccus soli TaxID=2339232 RepID=A0A3A3ZL31_9ACTN|nr:hypothetical protein [Vallicoccus soli]RJK96782.1 hypothetical protein D5H78_05785 [Vallicoccus soli]